MCWTLRRLWSYLEFRLIIQGYYITYKAASGETLHVRQLFCTCIFLLCWDIIVLFVVFWPETEWMKRKTCLSSWSYYSIRSGICNVHGGYWKEDCSITLYIQFWCRISIKILNHCAEVSFWAFIFGWKCNYRSMLENK